MIDLPTAVDIVARNVLAAVRDLLDDGWESYPEIGEHDWHRICGAVKALAPYPDTGDVRDALDFLAARTEKADA